MFNHCKSSQIISSICLKLFSATLVLTYASNASVATDVNYVCPLPADASICSFRAVIDGKRSIKGIVKEKEKAKAEYDAAVAQGKTAALLEQSNVEGNLLSVF